MTDSQSNDLNDLVLTLDDFASCGWKEALSPAKDRCYALMSCDFETAAKKAFHEGRQAHGKALKLLSDACSMEFAFPTKPTRPFKPGEEMYRGGQYYRSAVPEDFSESDMRFFAEVVNAEELDNPLLKGRLADIVWIEKRPANIQHFLFAQTAIDSYRSIPLDPQNSFLDPKDCWRRAIELANEINARDRLGKIENAVIEMFESVEPSNGYFYIVLADLIESSNLRIRKDRALMIAEKLESKASEIDPTAHMAEWFEKTAKWLKMVKKETRSTGMIARLAECYARDAESYASRGGHVSALGLYQQAIQIYRSIPDQERATHHVNIRIEELRTLLNESKAKASREKRTSHVSINIADIVQFSRNAVSGKSPVEAMTAFANLDSGADVEYLRENALDFIKKSPTLAFIPSDYLSSDSRLIARRSAMSFNRLLAGDDEEVVYEQMTQAYTTYVNVFVQGAVLPALEALCLEHRFREADFFNLVRQSPIVPMDRTWLYGKALAAGFDRDFAIAVHLLAPQIENIVRQLLKANGAQTTIISGEGFENEIGLSALMQKQESKDILGSNLHFEIDTLFCSPIGPNLRNNVAHGLVNDATSHSVYSVYAWWFALRLAFVNLAKEQLDSLLEDIDDSNLHDEADTDDPVEREAE